MNELRCKYFIHENKGCLRLTTADQRKSFNRTILRYFDGAFVHHLAKRYHKIDSVLTSGIFARWTVWNHLEQGTISEYPDINEVYFVVGRDACTILANLGEKKVAAIGVSTFLEEIILISSSERAFDQIKNVSNSHWNMTGFIQGEQTELSGFEQLSDLDRLPKTISFAGGSDLSMLKRRLRY